MKIKIKRIEQTFEEFAQTLKHCWGVNSKMDTRKIFASNDSILEIPEYYVYCKAPRSVAAQLRTHEKKHGMYFWMGTSRPDRKDALKGEYSRDQEVLFVMKLTARAIKEISHYRMCCKAEKATRDFMDALKAEFERVEPDLAAQMVPLCVYRGGICTEFNSCGYNNRVKDIRTVYVAEYVDYDDYVCFGVFTSEEAAERCIEREKAKADVDWGGTYQVTCQELRDTYSDKNRIG